MILVSSIFIITTFSQMTLTNIHYAVSYSMLTSVVTIVNMLLFFRHNLVNWLVIVVDFGCLVFVTAFQSVNY